MKNYSYIFKNVTIAFNPEHANFRAEVGAKKLTAPSLDAMKTQITNSLAAQFEPFKAIIYGTSDRVEHVTISHIERDGRDLIFIQLGERYHQRYHNVAPDTPENRKAIAAYQAAHKKGYAEKKAIDERVEAARAAIKHVSASTYKMGAK